MNQNFYGIIMAGGVGSRFWPVSTEESPKQFLDLMGCGKTLIQKTFERLEKIIPSNNIYILTNQQYKSIVLEQLPEIHENQIVLEPAMRNTAPCILLAALKIQKINQNAVMLVAPSDHWIEDEANFQKNIHTAFQTARSENALLTLGIQPTFPNTGFGYIEYKKSENGDVHRVLKFTEKPDYETAKEFLQKGNFLWNSGIFIWSVSAILEKFKNHMPDMYALFYAGMSMLNSAEEEVFLKENYPKAESISIDYGILEKSSEVKTILGKFDWNDLGTWGSLYQKLPKNNSQNAVIHAEVFLENSHNNIIHTGAGKQVILHDLSNYIVVDKDNLLLILPIEKEQEIKKIQELFKKKTN